MREIKFRAWVGSYMLNNAYGDWVSFDGVPYTEADASGSRNIEIKKAKDYILMQFTGLKDKYGKDIYEGDIIAINVVGGPKPAWVIEWHNNHGAWRLRDIQKKKPSSTNVTRGFWDHHEVIGNIYENPELLKP